ncbi:hypothetical protein BV25DRAFT_1841727 [Artomyces pyxidatus]|uniref:Uncharacterized protein n=1 Tax=Artomyces pyxidatus TaxID=48021 RepID=A0ACB8SMF1_9AGAM|nr:hypothetical protein BV25DRAFT_1841727 [Artomyces pyxidatus]
MPSASGDQSRISQPAATNKTGGDNAVRAKHEVQVKQAARVRSKAYDRTAAKRAAQKQTEKRPMSGWGDNWKREEERRAHAKALGRGPTGVSHGPGKADKKVPTSNSETTKASDQVRRW